MCVIYDSTFTFKWFSFIECLKETRFLCSVNCHVSQLYYLRSVYVHQAVIMCRYVLLFFFICLDLSLIMFYGHVIYCMCCPLGLYMLCDVFSYTKMGYAGNSEPQFILPSAIAIRESASVGDQAVRRLGKGVEDLDFYIGDEALCQPSYSVKVASGFYFKIM